jgi:molybdopterin-guanine dinucleotide biosynthesis protein A
MISLDNITGVILVGGKSLRMGKDKALLEIGGVPMYARMLHALEKIFNDVILVGDRPERFLDCQWPVYSDIYPGSALGGLFTGLHHSATEYIFVAPCDIPFPNEALIRHLCLSVEGNDAVVPKTEDGYEPLFAVYGKSCLFPMENMLERGMFRIRGFYPVIKVRYIYENEIARFYKNDKTFLNVNTFDKYVKISQEVAKYAESAKLGFFT